MVVQGFFFLTAVFSTIQALNVRIFFIADAILTHRRPYKLHGMLDYLCRFFGGIALV